MPLNSNDFQVLKGFRDSGDRYGYWSYLKQKGDPYANLALGVVTNETLEGYIANQYAASRAKELGKELNNGIR